MPTRRALTLGALACVATSSARADVADFYHGKTIQLIVGYGPGGGYDVYARLIARFMGARIPGEPAIVVVNMPGAGSLRAVNYLANGAPKDGLAFAHFSRDMPLLAAIGGNSAVQFDPLRLTWLGSSSSFADDAYVLIAREDANVGTLAQLRDKNGPPIVLGATGEGATGSDVPVLLRDVLGLNIKLITGYPDSGALLLAIERHEIDGRFTDLSTIRTARPAWLKPGSGYHVLMQFARATRHPMLPDAPTAREMAPNDHALELIELAETPYALARPFAAPPDIPADRAQALREAFIAVHSDPAFLAEAKTLRIDVSPIGPEAVLARVAALQKAPREELDILKTLQAKAKE